MDMIEFVDIFVLKRRIQTLVSLHNLSNFFRAFPASLFAETCRTGFWKAITYSKSNKKNVFFALAL